MIILEIELEGEWDGMGRKGQGGRRRGGVW